MKVDEFRRRRSADMLHGLPAAIVDPDPDPGPVFCAYCGATSEGLHSIHRDGFDLGPEVPLCEACGSGVLPTMEMIWARIRRIDPADYPMPGSDMLHALPADLSKAIRDAHAVLKLHDGGAEIVLNAEEYDWWDGGVKAHRPRIQLKIFISLEAGENKLDRDLLYRDENGDDAWQTPEWIGLALAWVLTGEGEMP